MRHFALLAFILCSLAMGIELKDGMVLTADDALENYSCQSGAMFDGKPETAWVSGDQERHHCINLRWRLASVCLSGIELNFSLGDYVGNKGTLPSGTSGTKYTAHTVLPKYIRIFAFQYGKWKFLEEVPVEEAELKHNLAQPIADVMRVRIEFDTADGEFVAISELKALGDFPAEKKLAAELLPAFSKIGGHYIWRRVQDVDRPSDAISKAYFRTPFQLPQGKKPVAALLQAAAVDRATVFLNGTAIAGEGAFTTREASKNVIPQVVRVNIPVSWLKDKNLLCAVGEKVNDNEGLYGVAYQLAVRFDDGSEALYFTGGATTKCLPSECPGWNTDWDFDGPMENVHVRFGSWGYPADYWSADYSCPWLEDKLFVENLSLTPAVPVGGEKFTLEFDVTAAEALRHPYGVVAQFGELPVTKDCYYCLGSTALAVDKGLSAGFTGKRHIVMQGVFCEEITKSLPVRLVFANGKQQAFASGAGEILPQSPNAPGKPRFMLGEAEPAPAGRGFPKMSTQAGRILLDGKPIPPLFWTANCLTSFQMWEQLAQGGIQMLRLGMLVPCVDYPGNTVEREAYLAHLDRAVSTARRYNPEAKVMLVLELEPHNQWVLEHPETQIVLADGTDKMGFYNPKRVYHRAGVASASYRKLCCKALSELIGEISRRDYAQSVVAVALGFGLASENNWGVDGGGKPRPNREDAVAGDYGKEARQGMLVWLRKKYSKPKRWAEAWKLTDINPQFQDLLSSERWPLDRFRSIVIWRDRPQGRFIFRNEAQEGQAFADIAQFQSEQRADFLIEVAEAIKKASGKRLLVGSYMGYIFPQLVNNPTGSSIYSGHLSAQKVRSSKAVDFFASPYTDNYLEWPLRFSVLTDSMRLYDKLYIGEGDIRTHVCPFGSKTFSLQDTCMVLRRYNGWALTHGAGYWLLGWSYSFAGPNGNSFFGDAPVLQELKDFRELYQRKLKAEKAVAGGGRVAVFVSEQLAFHVDLQAPANTVHAMLNYRLRPYLDKMGTAVDFYALEDLPVMVKKGLHKQYKFMLFFNANHLDASLRKLINGKLKKDDRTLMFFYAPGFHDNDSEFVKGSSFSCQGIQDILGIPKVDMLPKSAMIGHCFTEDNGILNAKVWWDKGQARFGDEVGPVFCVPRNTMPSDAEVLANLVIDGVVQQDKVSLLRLKRKDHTVIYSTVPAIRPELLARMIREAGVHCYTDFGPVVYANRNVICVTNDKGNRKITVRAPQASTWREFPSYRKLATGASEVTLNFKHHETKLLLLE